jgi:hypothetical protein
LYKAKILLQNIISCNPEDHKEQGFHKVNVCPCEAAKFATEAISAADKRLLHPANNARFAMTSQDGLAVNHSCGKRDTGTITN